MRSSVFVLMFPVWAMSHAQIPAPTDAPKPLSPEESAKLVTLPEGFSLKLVAAEPLIAEPSGVAFDEKGRLFVTELHGYNLEGQLDVDELNKTGQLDREVRRVQADEKFKKEAEAGTYGTVKQLVDDDGDGRMDRVHVWVDRLPPCYGLCAARGGVIVACAPDIRYLADNDGDGKAEINIALFTGFPTGPLERGINSPQWGPDGWIYVGGGHGGGTISGPNLKTPVKLPNSDFRIRADGSAIEPIPGKTHTYGFAFSEGVERFTISTRTPGIQIAPIEWRYLARNPDVPNGRIDRDASSDPRVYPTSKPHPWRTRRAEDPGFSKYYSDRYGKEEASPNGYFTSACSPLVYQDDCLPGLKGHLLACEPAQNLIYQGSIHHEGVECTLNRLPGEEMKEFLASSDPWFHPMSLSHGPDGAVWIVDFYREIIEDYSAIPRYLQQQYGVVKGFDRGRIWRLVHEQMPPAPTSDMSMLTNEQLTSELESPLSWRRETAERLLRDSKERLPIARLKKIVGDSTCIPAIVAALSLLDESKEIDTKTAITGFKHVDHLVQITTLRLTDRRWPKEPRLFEEALSLADSPDIRVQFQWALSAGEIKDPRVVTSLARLACDRGDSPFIMTAILTALNDRSCEMIHELLSNDTKIDKARTLLPTLGSAVASRRNPLEISSLIVDLSKSDASYYSRDALRGFIEALPAKTLFEIPEELKTAAQALLASKDDVTRVLARRLIARLKLESEEERERRLTDAQSKIRDFQLETEARLRAVEELSAEDDPAVSRILIESYAQGTPAVQGAILATLFSHKDWLASVIEALERKTLPASALTPVHRSQLDEIKDEALRNRARSLLSTPPSGRDDLYKRFLSALPGMRDTARGEIVFREKCGNCHQVNGIGSAVGPDLASEFQRAEETIVRDVLFPSEKIAAGYSTCMVSTDDGHVYSGLLVAESAGSLILRQPGGKEQTVLRKQIEEIKTLPVSLMPEDLADGISPEDLANVIDWLRRPGDVITLVDENTSIAADLTQGDGTAQFITTDRASGLISLRVTPLQRHSPKIPQWRFPIRENPEVGEFRYLRMSFKSAGAEGIMVELATNGTWPKANSPAGRYVLGSNGTSWKATVLADKSPSEWITIERDLWKDLGDCTLTGFAPTAIGGPALFDQFQLSRLSPSGNPPVE